MLAWAKRNYDIYHSDYGRAYGWYVEWQGRRIATLVRPVWDLDRQFWHDYEVVALTDVPDELAALRTNDFWNQSGFVFENCRYGTRVHDALIGGVRLRPERIILPMRWLYVLVACPELWKFVSRFPRLRWLVSALGSISSSNRDG